MNLLVTLGIPHGAGLAGAESDKTYASGAAAILDWDMKQLLRYQECVPPESHRHPDAPVALKFGSYRGDHFYACAPTQVVRFSLPELRCENVVSHPTFNDLHHVAALEDRLLVCNSGLELLQTFDYNGNLLDTFNAASKPTWERFSPDVDYRTVFTTKPHERHINYIFFYDGKTWLTRFLQRDAICVSDPSDVIRLDVGNPHDGIVVGDEIYFTTTNGHLLIVDGPKRRVAVDIDLNTIPRPLKGVQIGWCRGLEIKDGYAYVGFSRLRKTKWVEFARWVKDLGNVRYPARIEMIDLRTKGLADTFVFDRATGAAIFSIHDVPAGLMRRVEQTGPARP